MSETLLVFLISIGFGGLVFFFSNRYEKKNKVKIYAPIWGIVAFALVWFIWWATDNLIDIGAK